MIRIVLSVVFATAITVHAAPATNLWRNLQYIHIVERSNTTRIASSDFEIDNGVIRKWDTLKLGSQPTTVEIDNADTKSAAWWSGFNKRERSNRIDGWGPQGYTLARRLWRLENFVRVNHGQSARTWAQFKRSLEDDMK